MFAKRIAQLARWAGIGVLAAVAGCGGGGGGAGGDSNASPPVQGTFSATFLPASLDVDDFAGNSPSIAFSATLGFTGTAALNLTAERDGQIISSIDGDVTANTLMGHLTLSGDLPPGDYDTTLLLHACYDAQCNSEAQGSPVRLPVH